MRLVHQRRDSNDGSNKATVNHSEVAAWLLFGGYSTHCWKRHQLGHWTAVLEAQRPSFKNSEKSKFNFAGDLDPTLDAENFLYTSHNCHFL